MSGPLVSASAAFVAKNSRIPFAIEQSLRFNSADSAYMERTFSSAGNRQTWTYSCWFKHGNHNQQQTLWSAGTTFGVYDYINFSSNSGTYKDFLEHYIYAIGNYYRTSSVYRDDSAWYHVVIVWDTTNATAADRLRQYINGVRIDAYSVAPTITQNTNSSYINTAVKHRFGLRADSNTSYTGQLMDGYMAEVNFIDGTAVDPEGNLGEFDDNGVWRPIKYTGSYGSNGVYLKFDPSATNGIGHDHSGNGNNFTPTNFTTSGTGTDVMSDTPTTNWCTWNPLFKQGGSPSYSEGNLVVGGDPGSPILGTIGVSSGKWYWEVKPSSTSSLIGICGPVLSSYSGNLYDQSTGYCYAHDGRKGNNGSLSSYGASYSNDIIGVALDLDAGTLVFYKNGTSQGTAFTGLSGTFFPAVSDWGTNINFTLNCGQRAFEQTVPTGFNALNTANLPAPDIADGSDYFQTVLYTGNNTTHAITVADNSGNTWGPDFVWIKPRNLTDHHRLNDKVRGVNTTLNSNEALAEYTGTNAYLDSFDSDGFTISSSDNGWNNSSYNYVAWNWLAGGSGSSNTDGSITSTVSANPTAGFSIVTYTGTGSNATVGHGLGVAPKMVIVKSRNQSYGWIIGHDDIGWTKYLSFDTNAASTLNFWQNTAPSSTVFSIATDALINGSSNTYVAYCFAEVESYSKFGSYTGNGSSDGPFVYTGFRPRFLLYKRTDSAQPWYIIDSARDIYNVSYKLLSPNSSAAEDTGSSPLVDLLSNGFKPRNTYATLNASGGTYIYMALAENPFGGSGVSPATAR